MAEVAALPRLFSPVRLGPLQLPHRAVMSAHGMGLGAGGPGISDRYHAYLLERARGGAAMIGVESAPVHRSTLSRGLVIRLDQDECLPTLRRLADAVLEAVREAAGPAIAVGVRCSAKHDIPNATVDYTLEESLAAMALLDQRGLVDYVSVMAGSGWAEGVSIPAMHHPRVTLASEASAFKRVLRVPVIVAGRIRDAAEAEALISAGSADVVAMARTWIAEPHWARKLLDGREAQIRPCLSCNQRCVGAVFRGLPGSCILNPRAGRVLSKPGRGPRSSTRATD